MKKGVALIWVLILSSILLIISSTMVAYISKESKFSVQIEESSAAYSAAKSGVEWATEQLSQNRNFTTTARNMVVGGSTASVTVNNLNGETIIESTGARNNVRRKLEYNLSALSGEVIPVSGSSAMTGANSEGFTFTFDINGAVSNPFSFGLVNATATGGKIFINIDSAGRISFEAYNNNGLLIAANQVAFAEAYSSTNEYRVKIRYWKDTAGLVKIEKRTIDGNGAVRYSCAGTAMLDLQGQNLGNLNTIYKPGAVVTTDPTPPNSSYYQFDNLKIDNTYIIR